MKKIFSIVLAAASVCGAANAQDLYMGGSVGFMHNESKSSSVNSFTILPEIGYNLNNTWAVGTTIGYDYRHICGASFSSHLFEFNPYARWTYYRSSNNLVQLFVDGGVGLGLGWTDAKGDDNTAVTWNIGLRPGVAFNFTEHFSAVAHVGFLGYEGANNAAFNAGYDRRGGFMLDGNNLTLGFYYTF